MIDNLSIYSMGITLNQTEIHLLSTRPQDVCGQDPQWYECAGGSGPN